MYFPLFCKSSASFLEGASHPEELIEEAHLLGLPGIALTDRNGLYGAVKAHVAARERRIRLLLGVETLVAPLVTEDSGQKDQGSILLLARNGSGYKNLCRLLTRGFLRGPEALPKGDSNRNYSVCRPRAGTLPPRKGTAGVFWEEIASYHAV